jgi:hypothetical protein
MAQSAWVGGVSRRPTNAKPLIQNIFIGRTRMTGDALALRRQAQGAA